MSLQKQVFSCFGCGAKGNVLEFGSRKEGVTIREAAELVAEWCGLESAKKPAEPADRVVVLLDGDPPGRQAQAEIVGRLACRLYVRALDLPEGAEPDTLAEEVLRARLELPA